MKTVFFDELDESDHKLRSGKAVVRIESWMTDEQIGKHIRHYLVKAQNAPVTVQYEVLTEDMMKALNESLPQ
ncbi:hypothetical protein [Pantoea ananatis]|uniref:hypothetical protein n=1 Tax=Pantoea ananas TaxID=553 RepID=UPI001B30221C|nr:hypothetical protein [Pantoea ananatis]